MRQSCPNMRTVIIAGLAAILLAASVNAAVKKPAGPPAKKPVLAAAGDRLPLIVDGGVLKSGKNNKDQQLLERKFTLGAPGVWFLWVKAANRGRNSAVITWELDGEQPLHSARAQMLVEPWTESRWHGASRFPEHRAMIHVDKPGEHTLKVRILNGELDVDKIAVTLYFSAKPKGNTLDHTGDPGGGRAVFPMGDLSVDGFRPGWESPGVKADRTVFVDDVKGDDGKPGTSADTAWRSVGKVNSRVWGPGDAVLFRRGGKWEAGLNLKGGGDRGKPVTVGAFGDGPRPRIDGVREHAVFISDGSWWTIQDLEVTTDPEYGRTGVKVVSNAMKDLPKGIRILNVVSFDNGASGIAVGSEWEKGNGYDGVVIENCLVFCNGNDGIAVYGADQNGCRNSVVRNCTAYSNRGMAGIWIESGQNGLIERCKAYNNVCINIWTWNSINVTIRRCEAFRGHESDAGGFDIDWGCQACTVEYCYSHHNEGPGYLLMGHGPAKYREFPIDSTYNLMRFCVAEDDGGPITMCETFKHGVVHNNLSMARGKDKSALAVIGWPVNPWDGWGGGWPSDTLMVNNVLIGREGGLPAWVDDFATRQGNVLDGNLLFNPDRRGILVNWAGRENGTGFWDGTGNKGTVKPDSYRKLEAFRKATGQERNGVEADPGIPVGEGAYGRLPLKAYASLGRSPAAAGAPPFELTKKWLAERAKLLEETGAAEYGIPMVPAPVTEDYYGNPLTSPPAFRGPAAP